MATSQPHLSLIPGLQCKGACQADECSAWIRTCTTGLSGLLSARAGFMIQGACKQQKHFSCICCKPLSTATAVYATSKRNLGDFLQGAYQADSCMQYSACCCSYTNGSCKRCERADHTSCMPCMDWHSCLAFQQCCLCHPNSSFPSLLSFWLSIISSPCVPNCHRLSSQ